MARTTLTYLPKQKPLEVDADRLDQILGTGRRRGTPSHSAPSREHRVLVWHDSWRDRDRVLRWQGPCLGCGVQTWSFDDGENDPRGVLGDSALWPVDVDMESREILVRACPMCANDYDRYQQVKKSAVYQGIRTALPYNSGAGVPYDKDLIEAWGLMAEED